MNINFVMNGIQAFLQFQTFAILLQQTNKLFVLGNPAINSCIIFAEQFKLNTLVMTHLVIEVTFNQFRKLVITHLFSLLISAEKTIFSAFADIYIFVFWHYRHWYSQNVRRYPALIC